MKALIRQQLAAALWVNDPANIDPVDLVEALLPVVEAIAKQYAAEALERAYIEDRTTVAKLSPVERLTCFLVKAEDLVTRASASDPTTARETGTDHEIVVELYDGIALSMKCIPCRVRIPIRPERAAAQLAELNYLAHEHTALRARASDPPTARENDEPCVCDTDFTCLADEHDKGHCDACETPGIYRLCCADHQARMCSTCVGANHTDPAVPQVDDELRAELLSALKAPDGGAWWSPKRSTDLVLALPAVRRLLADAAAVQRVRDVIAFLDESAEVHAEQGLVTAHYPIAQRLRRALDGDR